MRLWPTLRDIVDRIDDRAGIFAGAILLGSLVEGPGDDLSDVDLLAVVHEGCFGEAWAVRAELSVDALFAWDQIEDETREVRGYKWLTRGLVKVECLIATPSSGMPLHEPVAVIAGDTALPGRFVRRGRISRADLEAYAQELRDTGAVHEVEARYGELKSALRRLTG